MRHVYKRKMKDSLNTLRIASSTFQSSAFPEVKKNYGILPLVVHITVL